MLNIIIRVAVLVIMSVSALLISPTIAKQPENIEAYEQKASNSVPEKVATQLTVTIKAKKDERAARLRKFFESQGSPLAPYSEEFVKIADKYELDWKLLPAITGVESTFGLFVPGGSYNPYGWNNGNFYFKGWVDSADYVANQIKNRWGYLGTITLLLPGPLKSPATCW
jgi:hypothetical protein